MSVKAGEDQKRLRELEKENSRLKAMFADVSLERDIIKDVLEKKFPELLDDIWLTISKQLMAWVQTKLAGWWVLVKRLIITKQN